MPSTEEPPLIKTRHTAKTLALALARQRRWVERHSADVSDRKTVSIDQACELVHVSRRTIYNWLALGKIEYARTVGGSVRVFEDSLWNPPDEPLRMAKADLPEKER